MIFEISVEGAEGGIANLQSALKNGFIGVIKQITGFIETINIQIRNIGNAGGLFEASGEIGIIVAKLCRKLFKGTLASEILFYKGKDFGKKSFLSRLPRLILGVFVEGGAKQIQQPFFRYGFGVFGGLVEGFYKIFVGNKQIAFRQAFFSL